MLQHHIDGELLELYPDRVLYWRARSILFIADLHFGKVAHFRKAGIAMPQKLVQEDIRRFSDIVIRLKPERVIILGDLFHSDFNVEWKLFAMTLDQFPNCQFELVIGNHDIIDESHFRNSNIICHKPYLKLDPFLLVHNPNDEQAKDSDLFVLSGHLHPGVKVRARAKQSFRLPCFYFKDRIGILPAFGTFTGMANMNYDEADHVFGIVEGQIIKI